MFFGRTMQVTFVKPGKNGNSEQTAINLDQLDYDKIGEIARDTVKTAAVAIVGIGAAFFVMGTAREILVNLANPANYR